MTPRLDVAAKAFDTETNTDITERPEGSNITKISEEDLARGTRKNRDKVDDRRENTNYSYPDGLLRYSNYNDDPDPAVLATVEQLVDTSKVIELEHIDFNALPKKRAYHFVKRVFDIVSCSIALVLCAIPMGIIAIMMKRDSPGPVFYRQARWYPGRSVRRRFAR